VFKSEIRILGFDDSPFSRNDKSVSVIGVIYRGGNFLDGILKTEVKVDGLDSTDKLAKLINSTRHKKQLRILMLDGLTFGGFNLVDISKLSKETKLPVMVINRKKPNLKEVKNALRNFKDYNERWNIVMKAGKIKTCKLKDNKKVYFQAIGLADEDAEDIIRLSCTHSQIPEVLRVAHLIGSGITKGESRGRA
jgi:endonuclease V-like protein UPF0215 family